MTVSMVCSYSSSRAENCLFSCSSVWFSMMICAFCRSSSDSNVSTRTHKAISHLTRHARMHGLRTFRYVRVHPSQSDAGREGLGLILRHFACMNVRRHGWEQRVHTLSEWACSASVTASLWFMAFCSESSFRIVHARMRSPSRS